MAYKVKFKYRDQLISILLLVTLMEFKINRDR